MSTLAQSDWKTPRNLLLLALFVALTVGMGSLIGVLTPPGDWYQSLDKPPFNPPNWIFGPVWTVLYVCIGIAGWRTFLAAPRSRAMLLWVGQMLLNWAWSPVWFGLKSQWGAFAIIVLMLVTILLFMGDRWNRDRIAALLFVPYALWVSFATVLNLSIALLN
jgi:translocator protein